jgi:peptidoglycan/LPS O-acetylase OafA/YrhL
MGSCTARADERAQLLVRVGVIGDGSQGYRADIDGLRALSVLAVILCHAGVAPLSGGYVGVDVFFVISGYLITRLLLAGRQQAPGAQLADFYARRARRILPALLVMLWISGAIAWLLYFPDALRRFGDTAAWSGGMLANVSAWRSGSYFDVLWTTSPLLHLWSIAVEEQFYLLYPLALLGLTRLLPPRARVPVVALAAAASFALCVWASVWHPRINYYSAPTRAWELLLGALLAFGLVAPPRNARVADALAALALAGIGAAAVTFDAHTAYPGAATLLPAAGAALLIVTGMMPRPPAVNRLLSLRPLVFVGLISYSLYLWHVPVLVFFEYFHITPPGAADTALLLLAIGVLGLLSWRFVEVPVRARRVLARPARFAALAGAACALTIAGGWTLSRSNGFPDRFPAEALWLADTAPLFATGAERCMALQAGKLDVDTICELGVRGAPKSALLWGDSHAWALLPAVEALARERNLRLYFAGTSTCKPLTSVYSSLLTRADRARCRSFNEAVLRIARRVHPEVVVLHAYWSYGERFKLPDSGMKLPGETAVAAGLRATARSLAGAARGDVCVVLGVPVYEFPLPYALAMARVRGLDARGLALTRAQAFAQQRLTDAPILALVRAGLLRAVDPKEALCAAERCTLTAPDGRPVYRDDNHLSASGALLVAPVVARCFD